MGISTVHGNASVEKTTYNAISLLTAIGRTCIPVYSGASAGLVRPAVHAEDIHGESGLDGTSLLPKPAVGPKPGSAVDAMAAALWATKKGTAWLVATGTMTNIAQLFILHPDLAEHIRGLSIMGGAIGNQFTDAVMGKVEDRERIGNWSAWAEFNILVDPEAAAALFANPILASKMVMIPLDVSHLVLATKEVQEVLLHGEDSGNPRVAKPDTLRTSLVELLMFFAKTYAEVFGITEGPPLHDPLAVAVVLDGIRGVQIPFYDWRPDVGVRERFKVKVVTEGTHEDAQNGAQTGRVCLYCVFLFISACLSSSSRTPKYLQRVKCLV